MHPRLSHPLVVLSVLGLAACAGGGGGSEPTPLLTAGTNPPAERRVAAPPAAAYTPTDAERKLPCKKLTGIVQVKLLQLRGEDARPRPSALATAAHQTVNPILGAGTVGSDPRAEAARERARVEALNQLLAEKSCKTFDIAAELQGTTLPRPKAAAPAGVTKP